MNSYENYVYKSEVNWSILTEGLTLPVDNQVFLTKNMGQFLQRGEKESIYLILDGIKYEAIIRNVNINEKFNRKKDVLQIRYQRNGELAKKLQSIYYQSYQYIYQNRLIRSKGERSIIKIPDAIKEFIVLFTTEYENTYIIETILADDLCFYKEFVQNQSELKIEQILDDEGFDKSAAIITNTKLMKIRKLNRKISNTLKLLYNYRCQICGEQVGQKYTAQIVESHHIDYFINSQNNDAKNLLIICPNHHRIIHQVNPVFDWARLEYQYQNGYKEGLMINLHLF